MKLIYRFIFTRYFSFHYKCS